MYISCVCMKIHGILLAFSCYIVSLCTHCTFTRTYVRNKSVRSKSLKKGEDSILLSIAMILYN